MNRQTDQNDVLFDVTTRLDDLGIDYMLTGSMALVHYANPRSTADIDIVLDIYPKHTDPFVKKFDNDYLVERTRVYDATLSKRMFNILEKEVIIKVDCVVRKDDPYSKTAFQRRARVRYTNDFEIWIIQKEDLILSKLNWAKASHSQFQLRDVTALLMNDYDRDYVGQWAAKLDVVELLEECLLKTRDQHAEGHDA